MLLITWSMKPGRLTQKTKTFQPWSKKINSMGGLQVADKAHGVWPTFILLPVNVIYQANVHLHINVTRRSRLTLKTEMKRSEDEPPAWGSIMDNVTPSHVQTSARISATMHVDLGLWRIPEKICSLDSKFPVFNLFSSCFPWVNCGGSGRCLLGSCLGCFFLFFFFLQVYKTWSWRWLLLINILIIILIIVTCIHIIFL